MERVPDWIEFWRELADKGAWRRGTTENKWSAENDPWRGRAAGFNTDMRARNRNSDPLKDLVASQIDLNTTVVDIGAGTGIWTMFLAPRVRSVTALDPSPAMLEQLKANVTEAGMKNVNVIHGFWPETEVEQHDISLCSHAIYSSQDFPAYINRMIAVSRRTCYLILRIHKPTSVMAQAALHVNGHSNDSPNFVVAYNALLQMGILPNVLIDNQAFPWRSDSIEDALSNVKNRLGIPDEVKHDDYLREMLKESLVLKDGLYLWPEEMISALVYWNVAS